MSESIDHSPQSAGPRRRRLRAVLAADVANFTGLVSINETNALDALSVAQKIAREELAEHGGWLFGMAGDGIFALFESAVDAVRCALDTQVRLAEAARLSSVRYRIGVHLGEVLFQDEAPFGESLVIAARLESLAEPGTVLVSEAVREAVAPRIVASFHERGVFSLKNSPRRVTAFSVVPLSPDDRPISETRDGLDNTVAPARHDRAAAAATEPAERPMPRLPKASQLVIESREIAAELKPAPAPDTPPDPPRRSSPKSEEALTAGCLEELTLTLMTHVGPVARVLVKRYAAAPRGAAELVDALSQEIPAPIERREFLADARAILARTQCN